MPFGCEFYARATLFKQRDPCMILQLVQLFAYSAMGAAEQGGGACHRSAVIKRFEGQQGGEGRQLCHCPGSFYVRSLRVHVTFPHI